MQKVGMGFLLVPDFLAMSLLVGVLLARRRREDQENMRLWTAALLLILLECAARIVYTLDGVDNSVHRAAHVIALDSYLAAGVLFLRSASNTLRRMPHSLAFLWLNAAPHLVLLTVYGIGLRQLWIYRLCIAAGIVICIVTSVMRQRGWRFYLLFALIWIPLATTASVMQYRLTIYVSLAVLYLLCAVEFGRSLPRGARGKIAVVAGFSMWALCFLTHPWIAETHPAWESFASEVWNMQKFIITVGLLMVQLEDQITSTEWLALHDELTGLSNRRLFDDRLSYALTRAARDGHRVALFNLDLDGFKKVNDTWGHDAGDILLRALARNLEAATRRTDTLARIGGDEFSLIAVDIGSHPAVTKHPHPSEFPQTLRIQASMLEAVECPVPLGAEHQDAVARVSASIGVAIFPDDGKDAAALMRLADQRMYRQKSERAAQRLLSLRRALSAHR